MWINSSIKAQLIIIIIKNQFNKLTTVSNNGRLKIRDSGDKNRITPLMNFRPWPKNLKLKFARAKNLN